MKYLLLYSSIQKRYEIVPASMKSHEYGLNHTVLYEFPEHELKTVKKVYQNLNLLSPGETGRSAALQKSLVA